MEKKYLNIDEIKKYELNILKFIDEICKKHNIKYFINYGTLIGAVRHKGFIPWDDDIDISMYREDYEKFIKVVNNEKHPKYEIMSYDTSKWYFQNFLVVIDNTTILDDHVKQVKKDSHIFVDVFPIDKFDDIKVIKKSSFKCYIKTNLLYKEKVYTIWR